MVWPMGESDADGRLFGAGANAGASAARNSDSRDEDAAVQAFASRIDRLRRELAGLRAELESIGTGRAVC